MQQNATQQPPVGAFIRPVGKGYAYCYKVLRVFGPTKDQPREGIECERWGLDKDGTPVRDGHQTHSWLYGLRHALPDAWRDEWEHPTQRWMCCPLYYRLMNTGPRGQMELLA